MGKDCPDVKRGARSGQEHCAGGALTKYVCGPAISRALKLGRLRREQRQSE